MRFLKVVGSTPEGRPVVSGLYRVFETSGLPLADQIAKLWSEGSAPGWGETLVEMTGSGMTLDKAKRRLLGEARDSCVPEFQGPEFRSRMGIVTP